MGKFYIEYRKRRFLFRINVEVVTPVWIGGYDSYMNTKLNILWDINEGSLKGLWRWWGRVLLGGFISPENGISELDNIISDLFGSTEQASKMTIRITKIRSGHYIKLYPELKGISRVDLMMMGSARHRIANKEKCLVGGRYEIECYAISEIESYEAEFIFVSLIAALVFDGIGKHTSRGFGKLKIEKDGIFLCNKLKSLGEEISDLLSDIYSSDSNNRIEEAINRLLNLFKEKARKYVEHKRNGLRLEPISSVVENIEDLKIGFIKIYPPNTDVKYILKKIGKSTLKIHWKSNPSIPGFGYHTWILGLPRSTEPYYDPRNINIKLKKAGIEYKPKKRKGKKMVSAPTGYWLIKKTGEIEVGRRKSPIRFSIIKMDNNQYAVIVYYFRSYDWIDYLDPSRKIGKSGKGIVHISISAHRKRRIVNSIKAKNVAWRQKKIDNLIDQILDDAIDSIKKLL
jgi:CRISPR type III-B/RAMP module RAMP protein Cmr1